MIRRGHFHIAKSKEDGSMMLMAVFSLSIGMILSLLFVNMARYVAASNAVEQAARVAARCITPTDPECISYAGANPGLNYNWFGVEYGPGGSKVFGQPYDYSAEMNTQTWAANFDTYNLHMVNPQVSYDSLQVPVNTFQSELNQYEHIHARIQGCGIDPWSNIVYRQVHSPNFPSFNLGIEQSHQNTNSWQPYNQAGSSITLPAAHNQNDGPYTLSSGQSVNVHTPWITVPELPGAPIPAGTSCLNAGGGNCNVDSDGNRSWRNFAYLAIKVGSTIENISGNPRAKWEAGDGTDGLVLRVRNAQGQLIRTVNLGGRDWSNVISGTDRYNLWLRGPSGSHGGNPGVTYGNLFIRRGHSFRVTAKMRATGGTLRSNVRIRAWYDNYNQETNGAPTQQCGDCGVHQQQPPLSSPNVGAGITSPANCGLPANYVWSTGNPFSISAIDSRTPRCSADALTFAAAGIASNCQLDAAVCSASWEPALSLCPPAPPERAHCGWNVVSQSSSIVGKASGSCPLASTIGNTSSCGVERVLQTSGNFGPLGICTAGSGAIASVNATTSSINSSQPSGAPSFLPLAESDLQWSGYQEYNPIRWNFSWFAEDEFGNSVSAANVVTSVSNQVQNSSTIYKRLDSQWAPDVSMFVIESPNGDSAPASFLNNHVSVNFVAEQSLPINQVYPFIETVYQIPDWGNPLDQWKFDYDLDCKVDQNCSGLSQVYESLESRLRDYAAQAVPAAADPNLWFNYSATQAGEGPVEILGNELTQLLECTPVETHCWEKTENIVSLGVFSNLEYPDGPAACGQGVYGYCYSELASGGFGSVTVSHQLDTTLAIERALAELQRVDSSAVLDGQGAHGVSVNIDFDNGVAADLNVAYRMPLSFPLNVFMGQEFLEISHDKQEVVEMRLVGRDI